jgi:amino acid adenylation domain-containing protein/non-ribosomal peptide synthase protein (TIGR01720 family)
MSDTYFPLHPAQQEVYTDQLLNIDSPLYNIGGYIVLKGKLNKDKFYEVINSAPADLDFFKLRFDLQNPDFLCHYEEGYNAFSLEELDFSVKDHPEEAAKFWTQERFNIPFDLSKKDFPFEQYLLKLSDDEYWFFGKYHHLTTDGYGFIVWVQYIASQYRSAISGQKIEFSYPSYRDAAIKAQEYMNSQAYEFDATYWKNKISYTPEKVLQKRQQTKNNSVQGSSLYRLKLDGDERKRLDKLQEDTKFGLQQLTIAALLIYFGKTSGHSEFIFGVPIHKRGSKVLRNIVGMFSGILPFKGNYRKEVSLIDLLTEIGGTLRADYRHQNYPVGDLSRGLKIDATEGYLYDVVVNYEPLNFQLDFGDNIQPRIVRLSTQGERTPLQLAWRDYGTQQTLELQVHFSYDYFSAKDAEFFTKRIIYIIEQFSEKLNDSIENIQILTDKEQTLILPDNALYPIGETIVGLFDKQVALTPDAIALVFANQQLSYRKLNEQANQLARYLNSKGIIAETLVPICLERSLEMIVGIIGILKAGGAYVPIDPEYPQERINYILNDLKSNLVITSSEIKHKFIGYEGLTVVDLKADNGKIEVKELGNFPTPITSNSLAYVIYTSGSTGKPKGVMIEHVNVVRLFKTEPSLFDFKEHDVWTMFHSFCFDFSVWELFGALFYGGRLVIVEKEVTKDVSLFAELLIKEKVTILNQTPSSFYNLQEYFIDKEQTGLELRYIIFGGEALNPSKLRPWKKANPNCKLINMYGITETTVHVTYQEIDWQQILDGRSLIGKPIPTLSLYLLNPSHNILPVGIKGELYVAGAGLSRGYLNRPELTSERFIPNPFDPRPNAKLYKTGDQGRLLIDGTIEYLGRLDDQVKIRGFRVELGEIENVIQQSGLVSQVVVIASLDTQENKRLVAYVVPNDKYRKDAIISYLSKRLPLYMVPGLWIELNKIPLTINGKVDKKSLPDPSFTDYNTEEYIAPQTGLEMKLTQIWCEVLNLVKPSVQDNFFDLGGDSILAIQLVGRIRRLGYQLQPRDIFTYQTISRLSEFLASQSGIAIVGEQGMLTGSCGLLPIQQWYLQNAPKAVSHFNQVVLLNIDKALLQPALQQAVHNLCKQHDALRFRYIKSQNNWLQEYGLNTCEVIAEDLESITPTTLADEIYKRSNTYQGSLEIESGKLIQVVLMQTPKTEIHNRLLIIIHHLAVDGVSWRILLEDLEELLTDSLNSRTVHTALKGSSYRQWYEALHQYSSSDRLLSQQNYWENIVKNYRPLIIDRKDTETIYTKNEHQYTIHLEPDYTRQLLQEVPKAYQTEINDILLAALARSMGTLTEKRNLIIGLEGHGRENITDTIDTSRTVGWFTSLFPLMLCSNAENDSAALILQVKEQLRLVPDKGIGYGVLKFITKRDTLQKEDPWDITFNYLGQLDTVIENSNLLSVALETTGFASSEEQVKTAKLSIESYIRNGELVLQWNSSSLYYDAETIRRLAKGYKDKLIQLIQHCLEKAQPEILKSLSLIPEVNVDDLARFISGPNIKGRIEGIYPLSSLQEGMLFHGLISSGSGTYINQFTLDLYQVDITLFRKSWESVLQVHNILRSAFYHDALGIPIQCVYRHAEFELTVLDYTSLNEEQQNAALNEYIKTDSNRDFDLKTAPLTRFSLIRLSAEKSKMVWTTHHIIFDGWSLSVLLEEFLTNYELLASGNQIPSNNVDNFGDYIQYLQKINKADEESYWRTYLTSVKQSTLLPFIKNQSVRTKGFGTYQSVAFQPDAEAVKRIKEYARKTHITVNTVMQGVWAYLLSYYTQNDHVVYAVTVSGRPDDLDNVEQRVGMYINTLPLHAHVNLDKNVAEWLLKIQEDQAASRQYQHTPINNIQKWTGIQGDFFDSLLVFLNYPVSRLMAKKWLLQPENVFMHEQNNFPLTITIGGTGELSVVFTYNTELLNQEHILRISKHFESVLMQILEADTFNKIKLLRHLEEQEVLNQFNNTASGNDVQQSLIDIIKQRVDQDPENTAIVYEQRELTYRELDERSNQFAHYLISRGVKAETLVPICLYRSPEIIVSILGVLKAGGAFVPIDPDYLQERISFMLEDTKASLIISSKAAKSKLEGKTTAELIELDGEDLSDIDNSPTSGISSYISPNQLAYVIYTSGSTGQPKGVMIEHGSLMNYLINSKTRYTSDAEGNSGSFIHLSYTFDASITALFMPLLAGKLIVIASTQVVNVFDDKNLWEYAPYDFIKLTPVHLSLLSDVVPETNRRRLTNKFVVGGEALLLGHFDHYLEKGLDAEVVNEYGPTEATVGCSTYSFNISGNNRKIKDSIPIGKPLDNTTLYVLSIKNEVLPAGIAGELYIGGVQVARGYLNRPDLTAEKFIKNPFGDEQGSKLYKTGDLARWLANGNLEYLGRIDDQVKVRGYRIELGEIESVLHQHASIRHAVVLAREDHCGNKRLVGYVVPADEFDQDVIQDFLLSKLPEYMVPLLWVELKELPVTPNGKVDRKALPDPDLANQTGAAFIAPRNETEEKLASIWQALLDLDEVGVNDDFFDVGGHSLLAIRLISSIRRELGVEISINEVFDYPTIALLAERVQAETDAELLPSITVASPRPSRIPLSFFQERLWFIDQLEGSLQYHITAVIRLQGELNVQGLEYSIREIVNRHEVLRTVYVEDNGRPYQEVLPSDRWTLTVTDNVSNQDTRVLPKYIATRAQLAFDLASDHMLRAELIVLSRTEHMLLVTMHHIASDAWSMPILVREVADLYKAFIEKRQANLPKLPLQYADYSIWQKGYLTEEILESKLAYWHTKLDGVAPLQLPTDHIRPAEMSARGASAEFVIPQDLSKNLLELSKAHGATLYMTLLSAFKVLLHRYSGQEDICVGTSIAGRPQQELEGLIGFFVNTLALRSQVNANNTFTSLLEEVRTTMLEAYAHQEVPFERVVDRVVKERNATRSPLFQVMLVLRNTPEVPQLELGNLVLTGEPYEHTTVKFDLTFFLTETTNGIEGSVLYSTDLFRSERIERMMKHFTTLLQSIVSLPEESIGKLKMLSEIEEAELKAGFNIGRTRLRKEKTLIELFENQAANAPDSISLASEGLQLTNFELNNRSNQLAQYLKRKGVKADTLVPLFVERGVEMIIGMLGILKAGGAYVPIDTDFPGDRVRHMLEDTGATIVLGTSSSRKKITDTSNYELVELDGDWSAFNHLPTDNLNISIAPEHLLYVIYTSGSTGKPKGVLVTQGNMLDYIKGLDECTGINECESYALVSTMATDLGNTVLFSWLVSGGTLHVFSKDMVSHIENLHSYFNRHRIECLKIVPSHWKALLKDGEPLLPTRLLVFGGESLQGDVIRTIREAESGCRVVNHYGPTETTVGKLLNEVDLDKEYGLTVPIGKPFSDTTIYVLNASGSVCPIGVPGELHIGGAGVARGYLNNPELTAEKFINDPFGDGGKVYKTGDLVSYDDEGNIVFLGRVDDQVKIRGYRVEPGEIGRVLEGCESVSQAVVISDDDHQGNKQLIGYIVPAYSFDREEILAYAKENLPDYMVPAHLIELEIIPLTANGKVDRKALPALDSTEQTGEYVAPRTDIEIQLAEIWQDVLEVDQVGIHDDFFELGGHSLLAVRLISAVRKAFKAELPISDVFDYPTVATLAERLSQPAESADTAVNGITPVMPRPDLIPLSFSQERLWFIDRMEGSVQYHVPAVLRLKGNLNITALNAALNEIVSRHEVLRTTILEKDGQAYQLIKEAGKWSLTKVEGTPYQDNEAALEEFIQQIIREPFDLSKDDMIRGHLITLSEHEFVLVVNLHHIASDGWSRSILVRELVHLYKSHDQGLAINLNPLNLQYADFAIWQRGLLQGEQLDDKLSYWKKKLDGVTVLDLPTDYVRPATQSTKGAIHTFYIEPELTEEIHALCKSHGTTLYMTLLAAYKVLLHRYSGQEDICVGSGIAGRNQQELEGLIGFFVNTLAMRSQVRSDMPFTELLHAVKVTTLEAYDHQEVPFEKVVDSVVRDRDISRNPVFQVTFVVQNTPDVPELRLGDLALSIENYDHVTTKFDITFSVTETKNGLQVIAEYNTDLYERRSIERMSAHFVNLLKSITKLPDQKISLLTMLGADEEALLLDLNSIEKPYPKNKNLATLFEEQAAKTPDAIAVVLNQEQLTYKQLNERSNQLAHYLQKQGVQPDQLIPICIERSTWMIATILGILKSGAAYVPIDPEYPEERIAFMLEDTSAILVLSSKKNRSRFENSANFKLIELDGQDAVAINSESNVNLNLQIFSDQLAYVIYTSGSTGRPKGVLIEHGSVVNLIYAQSAYFDIKSDERILQFSNYAFDASVEQIFLALSNGASLILIPEGLQYDIAAFEAYLKEQKISHLHATPFFLENITPRKFDDLKRVIAGGDVCRKELASKWRNQVDFYNEYGPTETTVTAIEYHDKGKGAERSVVPIGKPLANVSLFILDQNGALCPEGIPGELYIGGVQVARGYLNRPELTAERFITNPFGNDLTDRLYKTGDLARRLPDGNMEYLGRIDDQVKLRGYRIELGEIESVLDELEPVENSCVVVKHDAQPGSRLASYYVPSLTFIKQKEKELYSQQVDSWKEIHENEYLLAEEIESEDPEFDILGWNNSFTRQPIPAEQMREWLDDITAVILSQKPQEVLEIGSGTGLIYYQLAGRVKKYTGTDFSRHSVNKIKQRINQGIRDYGLTDLEVCAAHEISLGQDEQPDTIIINSVVQYFPGGEYLSTVIEKGISLLNGHGRIIIGDIRDNRTLRLFKSRLQLAKLQAEVSADEFKWAVDQEVLREEELCFSPEYFLDLQNLYPQITHVDIQWKQGNYINELSQYRFTVIIHVGVQKAVLKPKWQDWSQADKKGLFFEIKEEGRSIVAIKDAPNPRLWEDKQLAEVLENKSAKTTRDFAEALSAGDNESLEVQQLLDTATANGYYYRLFLDEDPFKVNILLEKKQSDSFIESVYGTRAIRNNGLFTNIPLFNDISLLLQKAIRTLLQQRLPDYMVPTEFTALNHLPLNSNGKVDRKFLSQIDNHIFTHNLNYQPPRNETEQNLVRIWQELLNVDQVGVQDNFFEIGGHSLLGMRVISSIRRELNTELSIKDLFVHPTIAELTEHLRGQQKKSLLPPVVKEEKGEYVPLSFGQERLWFIDQLEGSVQYHIPVVLRLQGHLNKEALRFSLQGVINRHEALRTVIRQKEGQGYQYFLEQDSWILEEINDWNGKNDDEGLQQFIKQLILKPFDLSKDHMLRAHLIKLKEQEYVLLVTMHHISSDGWSTSIIVRELVELYQSSVQSRQARLNDHEIQYSDFAIWQRKYLQGEVLDTKTAYWKHKLEGVAPLQLPTDYPRPSVWISKGAVADLKIEKELLQSLHMLSRKHGSTLFMTLLSAFKVLMYRYSGQQDICIGTSVAGRQQKETEDLIGFFINIIALRSNIDGASSFSDLLEEVKTTTLEAYDNQEVPFEKVVEAVAKERDMSRNPVCQVMFVLQNTPEVPELRLGDLTLSKEGYEPSTAQYDLIVRITETPEGLQGAVQYSSALFNESTINRMMKNFKVLLESVVQQPEEKISSLRVLTNDEQQTLLHEFNATKADYPTNKSILDLFKDQVSARGESLALLFEEQRISYADLDRRSNQLAHLLKSKGVTDGALVPICLERSVEMIIGIFGILKASAVYVPIDPDYPEERISYMLQDIGGSLIVSDEALKPKLESLSASQIIEMDGEDRREIRMQPAHDLNPINPAQLAYIIYTSGSTGRPKGVMIEHRSVVNLALSQAEALRLEPGTRTLQFASFGFDASCYEIFDTLLSGGCLVLCSKEDLLSADGLKNLINKHQIEVAVLPPSYQNIIIDSLGTLKTIISAGEPLNEGIGRRIQAQKVRLVNAYGPTENTVCASLTDTPILEDGVIVIGKAIANVQIYILDSANGLSPLGSTGELCLSGAQVARGYLNRDELTAEKFITNPFDKGQKLYKTGDLAKWLPDGNIEFLGRIDEQVKIRGYRIELGEIESVLQQSELVDQAVVLAKEDSEGHKRLVAYVQTESDFDKEELQSYLHTKLPEYMVPALWVQVDSFNLTSSGKIDRKALPDPEAAHSTKEYAAPQNELEQKLTEIWQELLDIEQVGVHDNFFELGGDSILTIQVVSRMRRFGYEFEVNDMFTYQTISDLSQAISLNAGQQISGEQGLLSGPASLLPIQQWYFDKQPDDVSHYNQSVLLSVSKDVTIEMLNEAVAQLVQQHDALRFKYTKNNGQWEQVYGTEESKLLVEDLKSENLDDQISNYAEKHQRSLDIENGKLIRVVFFKTPQTETNNRLFIVIHHLAIDGVSWRIILEDLEHLLEDLNKGAKPVAGAKSSSYREWYNALTTYGESRTLLSQKSYWEQAVKSFEPLPIDNPYDGQLLVKDVEHHKVHINADLTRRLLQEVPKVYHTEINDILLTALSIVLNKWSGLEKSVIGLEGHGREHIAEGIDTSRTVGWFTTLYPVVLENGAGDQIASHIKSVKEKLRQIPDKGLGYGVLKYIQKVDSLQGKEPWDIVFNYLGQLDAVGANSNLLSRAAEFTGAGMSEKQPASAKLSLNSYIKAGELVITWSYSTKHYVKETIINLAKDYINSLENIVVHCMEQKSTAVGYTPSDYGLGSEIKYDELDKFLEKDDDDDDNIMSF